MKNKHLMKKSYKILGIVVLFHPPENMKENILSYIHSLDKLILWNNSLHEPIFSEKDSIYEEKIIEMGNGNNVGIGVALNEAVNHAKKFHYNFLLTMDQDGRFLDFSKYLDIVKRCVENEGISIFTPNFIIHNKELYVNKEPIIDVEASMTSGALYPIQIFNEIGIFRDDFFIDSIDIEFCLRAKRYGIPTKIVTAACLFHEAGYQKKKHKFLWKTFFPNEYSPMRSYYIIRNSLITKSLYPDANCWKGFLYYWFYKRLFFVVLYEKSKIAKVKSLLLGYIHGKKGKTAYRYATG